MTHAIVLALMAAIASPVPRALWLNRRDDLRRHEETAVELGNSWREA